MKIALGADHGGYSLKEKIKKYLKKNRIEFLDCGTESQEQVEYPLYAKKVSKAVLSKEYDFGILCCGTGLGMSIAANKFKGIRAVALSEKFSCEMARRHNNANVLCLGARVLREDVAIELVDLFLKTPFEEGRHKNRLELIKDFENNCC